MAEAAALTPTGMSAVVGGDSAEVEQALGKHGLTAANNNGGGQIVAEGTSSDLADRFGVSSLEDAYLALVGRKELSRSRVEEQLVS